LTSRRCSASHAVSFDPVTAPGTRAYFTEFVLVNILWEYVHRKPFMWYPGRRRDSHPLAVGIERPGRLVQPGGSRERRDPGTVVRNPKRIVTNRQGTNRWRESRGSWNRTPASASTARQIRHDSS
jgi:hypothetical protein